MLPSDMPVGPSNDCVLNAAWPAFVRHSRLLAQHHWVGQLHHLLESDIHPAKPQRACRASSTADRCAALPHCRTEQSA
jgi:hypothetical protein